MQQMEINAHCHSRAWAMNWLLIILPVVVVHLRNRANLWPCSRYRYQPWRRNLNCMRANHPATKHYREDVFDIHRLCYGAAAYWSSLVFSQTANIIAKRRAVNHAKEDSRFGLGHSQMGGFQMPRCINLENLKSFEIGGRLMKTASRLRQRKGVRSTRLLLRCLPGSIRITQTCRRSTMPWNRFSDGAPICRTWLHSRTPEFYARVTTVLNTRKRLLYLRVVTDFRSYGQHQRTGAKIRSRQTWKLNRHGAPLRSVLIGRCRARSIFERKKASLMRLCVVSQKGHYEICGG